MIRLLARATVVTALAAFCASAVMAANGIVIDTQGKPIPKAKVFVFEAEKTNPKPNVVYTSDDGKFTAQPQGNNWCVYIATAQGYGGTMTSRQVTDKNEIKITLWPEKKFTGCVVDENGDPVEGATVRVNSLSVYDSMDEMNPRPKPYLAPPQGCDFIGTAKTGKDGRFTILHLPDTAGFEMTMLNLVQTAPNRAITNVSVRNANPGEIKIISPPACSVSGTVYLPGKSGPAPEGTEIAVLFHPPGPEYETRLAKVDKNGRFSFTELPPGLAEIMLPSQRPVRDASGTVVMPAPRPWALPAVTDCVLAPGKPKNYELVLVPGAVIKGKIVEKTTGNPPSSASVDVLHKGRPEGLAEEVYVNKTGEFAIRVAPGNVTVSVDYCWFGENYIRYEELPTPAPMAKLKLANGDAKNDLVLEVDTKPVSRTARGDAEKLPPADLKVKPGTYQLTWDPMMDSTGDGYMTGALAGDKARAKMHKLPKLTSKKPLLMAMRLDGQGDDGLLLVAFDESAGTGTGCDTAYVDCNRNGDLTDDESMRWRAKSTYDLTDWCEVQSHQGTGPDRTTNPVKVRWQLNSGRPFTMMRLGGWKGTIDTTKGPIETALLDYDNNGIYNDCFSCNDPSRPNWGDFELGDIVYADTNECGVLQKNQWSQHALWQGGTNILGGECFKIRANSSGSEVTITACNTPPGRLLVRGEDINGLSGPVTFLNLVGPARPFHFMKLSGESIPLPPGDYLIGNASVDLQKGEEKVHAGGSIDRTVKIESGKETIFTISGRLKLRILPEKAAVTYKAGTDQPIAWDICLGDTIRGMGIPGSGETLPQVSFDENGDLLAIKPIGGG